MISFCVSPSPTHLHRDPNSFPESKNIHEIPKIKKIVISRGLGNVTQTPKMVHASLSELRMLSGQHGIVTRARRSVAGFKIRENIPVGVIVTIRGKRINAFTDRLTNLALPRIRDFQGVSRRSFDGFGNYNVGLEEQLIFPEIPYEQIDQLRGLDISIVTSSKTNEVRFHFLSRLGIPFKPMLNNIFNHKIFFFCT
jgi:large subunit ribosomal protein L5